MNEVNKNTAYSLGVFLGEYIVKTQMPSLYHNAWTPVVISTTWGEYKELKRLEEAWYTKRSSEKIRVLKENPGIKGAERYEKEQEAHKLSDNEWNELMKYRYTLKEKYLPHTLKCYVPFIDFSDEETNKLIKKGLINYLWNTDRCEYSVDDKDIIFETEVDRYGPEKEYSMTHTFVTLKLSLEAPSSYTGKDWIEIKTPQK
jgi:hypothetical protein